MVKPVSPSAPVTVQVREYIDPAIGVATPVSTLTVMDGSENQQSAAKNVILQQNIDAILNYDGEIITVSSTITVCVCCNKIIYTITSTYSLCTVTNSVSISSTIKFSPIITVALHV